jgi:hypothetical protein
LLVKEYQNPLEEIVDIQFLMDVLKVERGECVEIY